MRQETSIELFKIRIVHDNKRIFIVIFLLRVVSQVHTEHFIRGKMKL